MIQAFLFDLDGVLTDTSEFHYRGWKRLADEEGLPFDRDDNEALRGVSRRESLLLMLKGRAIPEATLQTWMERKNTYYLELVTAMNPGDLLPGALDLLQEIRTAGLRIAIASSSKNAPLVIDRLQIALAIDALVDGNLVTRSKPAPDLFIKAAQLLRVLPNEAVVVEDAAAGVEAGKAGGMWTVGLGPVERVGMADLVLPSLEGVHLSRILAGLVREQ
ncbi:MAG TPA: beta-phosphoglucomutase [Anaerolineaceae bacterium]|jgi:beta-phosphoglucomutase